MHFRIYELSASRNDSRSPEAAGDLARQINRAKVAEDTASVISPDLYGACEHFFKIPFLAV